MPLRERKYKYDQWILKVYGTGANKLIKLLRMNVLRTQGIEDESQVKNLKGKINDEKLDENIRRTKARIFELAFCNPWDWFFTATLDRTKYDRTDLAKWHKDLTQWFRDYNKKHGTHVKFLLIPELHKDGMSWHMHGFLYGLPVEHLYRFQLGDKMGAALAAKVKNGDAVYNWSAYAAKFGFCDLEPIKNPEAVSKYATKYITKSLSHSVTEVNAHMYYHSRGLAFAETIKKGSMDIGVPIEQVSDCYQNDYCDVYWLPYSDELLRSLSDSFL